MLFWKIPRPEKQSIQASNFARELRIRVLINSEMNKAQSSNAGKKSPRGPDVDFKHSYSFLIFIIQNKKLVRCKEI